VRERCRMTKKIPQGWLSVLEAIQLVVRYKYPGQDRRAEGEAAWQQICHLAHARDVRALILTASGETVEADLAQFAGLQERYLFQLTEIRGVWPGAIQTGQASRVRWCKSSNLKTSSPGRMGGSIAGSFVLTKPI
jgi:hypothetical protein